MDTPGLSGRLAERIATLRVRDLPPAVVAHARLVILDTLGAMVAATSPRYPGGRLVMAFVAALGGRAEASLIGQGVRTSAVHAALANGTLAYYCDIEPHHPGAVLHGPAVALPAALAVAETVQASGSRLVAATVLGIEVAGRVSDALDPVALYERGFHPTAVAGAFGAAAAAGWLLRLRPARLAVALGLAMQQAGGLLAWAGDPTEQSRPLNPGLAARNGVTAARLAALGFGGPPAPFDGPYDAFAAFSGRGRPDALLDGWGRRFYTAELAFKRHASCAFTHPGLDALLGLAADHRLAARDVAAITLRFPRHGAHMIDNHPLRSHCAQYVLPVGLVFGRVTIDDILTDRTRHPDVARLRAATRVVADAALDAHYPARYVSVVILRTHDGRELERRVEAARGTVEHPMTAEEIRAKFRVLVGRVVPPRQAAAIAAAVETLPRAHGVDGLARVLRARPRRRP